MSGAAASNSVLALLALVGLLALVVLGLLAERARRQRAPAAAPPGPDPAREEMQQQLIDSRRRLQLLLDHMPDGVFAFDAAGRIEWINPAARLIFQRSAADTVGVPIAELIPGIATAQAELALSAPPGVVPAQVPRLVLRGRRRDGSEFPLELALVRLEVEGAQVAMGVCRDLADSERIERMKREFVTMVSHELRTPLTSLRGSLALLADGTIEGLPADARRLLKMASDNSERLVVLVNDILDFEKLRAGALRIDFQALDLAALAQQAVDALEGMAARQQVLLRVLAAGEAFPVRADPARLTQVLANLLSNAIKLSPPHGTVHVIVTRRAERVRLVVRDQGPGVPEEFIERLFLPFEQARDPQHRKHGGTGLGLAISRALMDMMQGAIGLEPPRPGDGASFWIELPLDDQRPSTFGELAN